MKAEENIYQHKVEEFHNWNFALNVASGGFDNLGLFLVGWATVLPAFLTLFTKSNFIGLYIAFGFLGLAGASMMISYHNMIIELAPPDKIDTYMGLINGIRAPSLALTPLLGGCLADIFSYRVVFIIALLASGASGVVLLKVRR